MKLRTSTILNMLHIRRQNFFRAVGLKKLIFNSHNLKGLPIVINKRTYVTRSELDSPFDHLPKTNKKYINWKITSVFFAIGAYLAYNESLFDYYEEFTDALTKDELLPVKLEYQMKNLPIYQKLAHSQSGDKWIKLNSWENLDRNILDSQEIHSKIKSEEEYNKPSLHTHTLAKPGGILIKPAIFYNTETNEGISIIHVGHRLCGYPFIVHGGMIATILNETFKRNASLSSVTDSNLKDDFKVENLSISYKYPSFANQFLIVKTKRKEGSLKDKKTITLESVIESQNEKVLVKSEAILHDTGRASKSLEGAGIKKWLPF